MAPPLEGFIRLIAYLNTVTGHGADSQAEHWEGLGPASEIQGAVLSGARRRRPVGLCHTQLALGALGRLSGARTRAQEVFQPSHGVPQFSAC